MAEVTVDDAVSFLGRLSGGALATFEATRNATGAKNALSFELYGSRGSISFDLERLNELVISGAEVSGVSAREHDPVSPSLSGATRILVTEPSHPYMSAWWPPGHVLGWEHSFVHQARDLLAAIGEGHPVEPSFSDGLAVQRVLAAVASSAATGTWVTPERKS
jgi:predicted dehydrogenase